MSYRRAEWVCLIPLLLAACARQQAAPHAVHIAILRFENLGEDPSSDWIGRAIPVVLEQELAGAPGMTVTGTGDLHALDRGLGARPVSSPGVSSERTQSMVAGTNRVGYGYYSVRGGRLHAHLWMEDPQTQKIVKIAEVTIAADNAVGAATALARNLTARPQAPYTRNEASIRAYSEGLESNDPNKAVSRMQEAIAADPDFGPAYRSLSELYLQRQDRDAAKSLLEHGVARSGIAPIERAQMQLTLAGINNDPAARQQALASLVKLEPRNVRFWQTYADTAMARHDYAAAVDGYRHALQLDPSNVLMLNQLGYAAAYAGQFDEGAAALQKYHSLRPKDANAIDSLGDLNLIVNRYHQAEDYYHQALQIDPNFQGNSELFKAAMARLMTGDVTGGEDLYKQYIAARTKAHDAAAPLLYPSWLWLTGRRKQASAQLLAYARVAEEHNDKATAARAYSQLAIWSLIANDRAGAQEMAQKAVPLADSSTAGVVAVARFLSQPSASPDEWQARVERFVPNAAQTNLRDEMLGLALLLDGHFDAAKKPLRNLYDTTGTSGLIDPITRTSEGITALLAWPYVESGDFNAAAPLLANTPPPSPNGIGAFTPMWFPRIFELRAAVDAKTGKADDAKQNADVFAKLSGK